MVGGQQWNDLCTSSVSCASYSDTVSPTVTDGTAYQLVFRSTDRSGNVKDSAVSDYVGDTVAPILSQNVGSGSAFSGAVSVSGTSSDARSGISSAKVSFQRLSDGKYWSGSGFDPSSETFLVTSTSNAYANWNYSGFSVPAGDAEGTQYALTVL
jgi:hypothetical protein